jgi:hypothetical protein
MPTRSIARRATVSGFATPNAVPIYVDTDDNILKIIPAGSGTTEVQVVDGSSAQTLTNKTLTSPTFTAPSISGAAAFTGNAITGVPVSKTISFTEGGAAGTLTGTVVIPAGATILNIQVVNVVNFGAGTSATLKVGDSFDDDGWFTGVDMKGTDLVVGEVLDISNAENWGAKQGAYLVAATGRKGGVQATNAGVYYGTADTVAAVITTVGTTSTAGRAFMTVTYAVGQVTAATYVAT